MMWPTPTAGDRKGSGSAAYSEESGRHPGTTLTDAAVRWPTPTASLGSSGPPDATETGVRADGGKTHVDLTSAVTRWATPQARDDRGPTGAGYARGRASLPNQLWATPTAANAKAGNGDSDKREGGATLNVQTGDVGASETESVRLNPAWVEALQGLPIGWTEAPGYVRPRKGKKAATTPRAPSPSCDPSPAGPPAAGRRSTRGSRPGPSAAERTRSLFDERASAPSATSSSPSRPPRRRRVS